MLNSFASAPLRLSSLAPCTPYVARYSSPSPICRRRSPYVTLVPLPCQCRSRFDSNGHWRLSAVVMVAQGGPDPVHGIQAANAYSDMDSSCTLRRTVEVSWLSSPWRSGSTWTLRCTHLDKRAINLSFQKAGLRSLLTSRCLAFSKMTLTSPVLPSPKEPGFLA